MNDETVPEITSAQASGAAATPVAGAHDFPIVGIGASAGGVHALKAFFSNTPVDSGMAFVAILHLSPDHESQLAQIISAVTTMPVAQVRDRVVIERDSVYVIPPNKSLAMIDGAIAVSEIDSVEERRAPIDIFFRTLAAARGERAFSVILTGTGADGSSGLKRIKEVGGCVIVQDPAEAEYSDMPHNAIATGLVDQVLKVAEIPACVVALSKRLARVEVPPAADGQPIGDEKALREILKQLRIRTGHDFSGYKRTTVLRRLNRRMGVLELADLAGYASYLTDHPDEAQALLRDLLISVTHFFRDNDAFAALQSKIIPRLFEGKSADDCVRVWVAGCATGEEAYSVAMLLIEYASNLDSPPRLQIFATDIDSQAIALAREGFYTATAAADVPPERLQQFFDRQADGYRVRKDLRERILFAVHNVIKDPPFSKLDLVCCRNLLIYLNRGGQERAMSIFSFALLPARFFFLGSSESADSANDAFAAVDREHRIYQSREFAMRAPVHFPELTLGSQSSEGRERSEGREGPWPAFSAARPAERASFADLHLRLLEQYAPPSCVVNGEYEIVHLSEGAGNYLRFTGGEPSRNLLNCARPELRLALRGALYQATLRRTCVESRGIALSGGDEPRAINLIVRPVLRKADTTDGFILVVFEPAGADDVAIKGETQTVVAAGAVEGALEDELVRVKAQLRSALEHQELQGEEFKASTEELQATNEELRSATEEMETGREELQSVNEELSTVNQELKVKIDELGYINSDFRNLINSTDIATVFLDRNFNVKLFTPRARDLFNLISADRGRALADITSKFSDTDLHSSIEHVLDSLQPLEREVRTRGGDWHAMRVLPYRTTDNRIDGVVLTFMDIDERKRIAEALQKSEAGLRLLIENVRDYAIVTLDENMDVTSWNPAAAEMFGYAADEIVGQSGELLFTPEDRANGVAEQECATAAAKGRASDERWHLRKDGSRFFVSGVMAPLLEGGKVRGYVKVARDLTQRNYWETALRSSEERLRLLLESAKDYAIFTTDRDRRVSSWNAGAQAMFGYGEAEVIGQSADILFSPEDRDRGEAEREAGTAAAENRAESERWHARKDGSRFYASGVVAPLRDGDGAVLGFVKIMRDLTASKRADEVLHRSETSLRHALAAADMGSWRADLNTRLITRDANLNRMLGLAPAESIAAIGDYFAFVHPDDKAATLASWQQSLDNGSAYEAEYRVVRKDGATRWIREKGAFIAGVRDAKGTGSAVMTGVALDITAIREAAAAEVHFRQLFESAPGLYIVLEPRNYEILAVSDAYLEAAMRLREDLIGRKLLDMFPDDPNDPKADGVKNLSASLERVKTGRRADVMGLQRYPIRRPEAQGGGFEERWWSPINSPVFGPHNDLAYIIHRVEDVTAYILEKRAEGKEDEARSALESRTKQMEAEVVLRSQDLERANQQLRASEQKAQEVSGELARLNQDLEHRVTQRTALAEERAMQLRSLATQLTQAETKERRRIAQVLHDNLQQLLLSAKFRLRTLKIQAPQADFGPLLESIDESLKASRNLVAELSPPILYQENLSAALRWLAERTRQQHGLPIEVTIFGQEPAIAEDLKVLLYQSVRELLLNIVKHAAAGRAEIRLSGNRAGWLIVRVEDDGSGFQQASGDGGGTGLGLLSIRERVEVLGGRMMLRSRAGKGTRVSLRVPAERRTAKPAERNHFARRRGDPQRTTPRAKVLLVDDHAMVRQGLRGIIEDEADMHVVGEAQDGLHAIALAGDLKPDVILMDINMPRMDGIEATRRIKTAYPSIHVIGLSMHADQSVMDTMFTAGVSDYVTKDTVADVLCETIRKRIKEKPAAG